MCHEFPFKLNEFPATHFESQMVKINNSPLHKKRMGRKDKTAQILNQGSEQMQLDILLSFAYFHTCISLV